MLSFVMFTIAPY